VSALRQNLSHHFGVVFLGAILMAPMLFLIGQPISLSGGELSDVFAVLLRSSFQAALSSALAIVLGVVGGLGLLSLQSVVWIHVLETVAMIPAFLPPLFVVVGVLNVTSWMGHFPYGLIAVIATHALMNVGYVSTRVRRLFEARLGSMGELALIEGASSWRFLWIALRLLSDDLLVIGFVLFGVCLTSFAIPLILGGASGTTLEVLIYSRLRWGAGLHQAVAMALIQIGVLFSLGIFLLRGLTVAKRQWSVRNPFQQHRFLLFVALLPTVFIVGGLTQGLWVGIPRFMSVLPQLPLMSWILCSLMVGITVGLGVFLLSSAIAFLLPHAGLQSFLVGFAQPSTAVFGLSLVILGAHSATAVFAKMVVGLTLILTPFVFRWVLLSPLFSLRDQIDSALVLGADRSQIFAKIVFPQIAWQLFQGAGLAAVWGACDFSLSSFVAGRAWTLALGIDDMLAAYQHEMATVLLWIMFAVATFCYLIFAGVGYGLYQRSVS
jgi:ABC-type Fe3+ transport system permease subunit